MSEVPTLATQSAGAVVGEVDERARVATALLLQRRIFQLQAEKFSQLLASTPTMTSPSSSGDNKISLPPLMVARAQQGGDGLPLLTRLTDDIEMALLGTLDKDGKISFGCQVEEFIVIMTRVVKVSKIIVPRLFFLLVNWCLHCTG
jgi:hypothetical protein